MTTFYRTTISVEITTTDRPAGYDERFWSHLRDSLADNPGTLQVGTDLKTREISRLEAEDAIDDLDDRLPEVTCYLCGELAPERTAHRHAGRWVGDACCWEERLRGAE